MIHYSTIIKGTLVDVQQSSTPPSLIVHASAESQTYAVPASRKLIEGLDLEAKIGQSIILTAITNADNTIIDTMTVLMEPTPK